MIGWLKDVFNVVFRYRTYLADKLHTEMEVTHLRAIANIEFTFSAHPLPLRAGHHKELISMTPEQAYFILKYGSPNHGDLAYEYDSYFSDMFSIYNSMVRFTVRKSR